MEIIFDGHLIKLAHFISESALIFQAHWAVCSDDSPLETSAITILR